MQRVIYSLLFILCGQLFSNAQTISFLDRETLETVPGIVLSIESLGGDIQSIEVTNEEGEIDLSSRLFPIVLKSKHLGYESITDTLTVAIDRKYYLKPNVNQLDDVIVTGQFNPQSAKNSVFRVQTIEEEIIRRRGAFTLEEVLNNQLSVRVSQDLAIGSSTISLQGISSQNVKILIDGVPLVSRSGNGNGADLSQINLQNIERIEVVEGPMAVNFGANALAGVINLISKKDFENVTEIGAFLHTETAGNEYGLDRGRHVQSISVNHRLNKHFSILISGQHNDFQGFRGEAPKRQNEWNPKEQWSGNGLLKYQNENHSIHYRLDLLNQLIEDFGLAQNNFLPSGENQPFAIDENYRSKRVSHQIQAEGRLSFLNRYTSFISFSDFEREKRRFSQNLVTNQQNLTTGEGDQDISTYRVWEFAGTGFLSPSRQIDLQLGYQVSLEKVGGGRILNEEQGIEEYAIYGSAEWRLLNNSTLRPGVRYSKNAVFGSQLIPSLQFKYDLSEKTQFRLSYGRGFRSPSVRELFFEFVDSNHRIFGNADLQPEKSNHFSLNVTSDYKIPSTEVNADLNIFFNDIQDQISLGQNVNYVKSTTYLNISRFKTLGAALNQKAQFGALSASLGLSYIGRFNRISENQDELVTFFYSPELTANLSYQLPNSQTTLNTFYKYTGRIQSYFTDTNDQNEQVVSIGEISGYHLLDLTAIHSFNSHFDLTLGVRNALDITRINNSGLSGGAHSGGPTVPVSYGRSYFLKLSYNLNLK